MTKTLARDGAGRKYRPLAPVAVYPMRSAGAEHQRHLKVERAFFAFLDQLAAQNKDHILARLRTRFENAADPQSTPDLSDDALRQLCRELHAPDQRDDTCRFDLMDGAILPTEEESTLRALYLTAARIARVTRCLEGRKVLR